MKVITPDVRYSAGYATRAKPPIIRPFATYENAPPGAWPPCALRIRYR